MAAAEQLLDAAALTRALLRMSHQIAERNGGEEVVILGIQQGGVQLARRLAAKLERILERPVPAGTLDVSMHRDDLNNRGAAAMHPTELPCDISDRVVVLVDDVLFSGRTVRAAMDTLNTFGRPRRIQLAVLIDRGHRDLPIQPDFTGREVTTRRDQRVEVRYREPHGEDAVLLHTP